MARSQEAPRIPAPGLMAGDRPQDAVASSGGRRAACGAPKLLSLYYAPGVNRFFGDRTLMVRVARVSATYQSLRFMFGE
jgi:hypothetical protein